MAGGGFGFGGFGLNTFGQDSWAWRVLYLSAPLIYRQSDEAQGGLLAKYARGQETSFEYLRDRIQKYFDLRDPFKARTAYSTSAFFTFGRQVLPLGEPQLSGSLGVVQAIGSFKTNDRTATFGQQDIGKVILVRRSSVAANNLQAFTITSIVNDKEVLTEPRTALDAGPIRWEMRPIQPLPAGQVEVEVRGGDPRDVLIGSYINDGENEYEVVARQIFWQSVTSNQLLTEREGTDGSIDTQGRLLSDSYSFQSGDVGKWITLETTGVSSNNGAYEIVSVENGKAVFAQLLVVGEDSNVFGNVIFRYKPAVTKNVSVEVVYEEDPSLPLEVTQTLLTPDSFNVRIRLATGVGGEVTTVPSDIVAALAAEPLISPYIEAVSTGLTPEAPVGTLSRTILKPRLPSVDSGPFYWAMRPFARLTLKGPLPLGVLDGEGYDLSVVSATTVRSSGSPFRAGDVGKLLTIGGSSLGNNGVYQILSYVSPTDVVLSATLQPVGEASNLYWCRRSKPLVAQDPTRLNPLPAEVRYYEEPLLDYLAYDFGLRVDRQQTEIRQRASVRQSSVWMKSKGTKLSIEQMAILSGFTATVNSLTSATAHPRMGDASHPLPYDLVFFGYPSRTPTTQGSLYLEFGTKVAFGTTDSLFLSSDVGKVLKITDSGSGYNGHYVIEQVLSANKVYLLQPSIGANLETPVTVMGTDLGPLTGEVGEVFSTILPAYPIGDDIEWDSLAQMYDLAGYDVNDRPGIDFPNNGLATLSTGAIPATVVDPSLAAVTSSPIAVGWFDSTLPTLPQLPNIVSLDPSYGLKIVSIVSAGTQHTLTIQGEDLRIVKGGEWKLYDSTGELFYFDTVPVLQPTPPNPAWTWTLVVSAFAAPTAGDCHIEYIAPVSVSCETCPTYKLRIVLTANQVLNEGPVANDKRNERVRQSIQQVLPAEAEIYWVFA